VSRRAGVTLGVIVDFILAFFIGAAICGLVFIVTIVASIGPGRQGKPGFARVMLVLNVLCLLYIVPFSLYSLAIVSRVRNPDRYPFIIVIVVGVLGVISMFRSVGMVSRTKKAEENVEKNS